MSQENVEVVRRTMALFEQGEVTSIFAQGLATSEVELRPAVEVPGAGTYVGLDGVSEFMRVWTESFDRWTMRTERVIDAGGEVVALSWQEGWGKASGARVETSFGMVFTIEDCKIKRVQIYVDPEAALKAAGPRE
jgi:ketosteroid isomerase-like protein